MLYIDAIVTLQHLLRDRRSPEETKFFEMNGVANARESSRNAACGYNRSPMERVDNLAHVRVENNNSYRYELFERLFLIAENTAARSTIPPLAIFAIAPLRMRPCLENTTIHSC